MLRDSKRNFIYAIVSSAPSPTGRGTCAEWLEYYKLSAENDAYVSLSVEDVVPEPGDVLWFQVDDRVVARVTLSGVRLDPLRGCYELQYFGPNVLRLENVCILPKGESSPIAER